MSRLTRRMLGLSPGREQVAPTASPASLDEGPSAPIARGVGLKDAAMAGLYNSTTGELFKGMPIGPSDVVVDVGCGEAGALSFCASQGADVIAIDHHEETLQAAREALEGRGTGRKQFHTAAGEDLPLEDNAVTRVICMEVLEHVEDPKTVLRELARIGRPGALYMITVPDALQEHLQERVAPPSYFQVPNHVRIIERDEFQDLAEGAGLEILEHGFYGFYWSIWFALFWSRGVDIDSADDPVLNHWASAWNALLDSDTGPALKAKLDEFMPKAQVIIARKPEPVVLPGTDSDTRGDR